MIFIDLFLENFEEYYDFSWVVGHDIFIKNDEIRA